MNKPQHIQRRTTPAAPPAPAQSDSRKNKSVRYALYALLIVAAVGIRVWLTGPTIPTPSLEDLDQVLIEEIENAKAEIWESPQQPERWGRLGMLYAAHSFPHEAVQCFERAFELDTTKWKWPYLRSIALEQTDRTASLEALSQAAELADDDPFPRLLLVERLMEQGEYDETERQLQIVLQYWPEHPRAQLNRARLLFARDDARAALASLKHALDDRHTQRSAHQLLVQIHRQLEDDAAASAALDRLAKLPLDEAWPDRWREAIEAFRISKGAYIARIYDLGRRGDHDKLARTAAESIERYPELAHLVRGRERLSRGDLVAAERALREAARLDPNSVDALVSLGEVLLRQDQTAAAVETFRRATQAEPAHGQAHLRLGEALVKQGDNTEAVTAFRTATQFMPTSADAHRALADALIATGDSSESEHHRRQAERLSKK